MEVLKNLVTNETFETVDSVLTTYEDALKDTNWIIENMYDVAFALNELDLYGCGTSFAVLEG